LTCLGAALVFTGCSSASKIAKNSKGNVYLEEVTDWSFEANHPVIIDQVTLMKVLKGVYGTNGLEGSSEMPAGGSKPMRVFSDEDAEFLAPLLAQGLSQAKPEQLVGFRVSSSAGSGSEPIAGSIYVQQEAIHFTISKGSSTTTFLPQTASHTEYAPPYAAGGMAGVTAHVIDYRTLASAPMPPDMPVLKAESTPQPAPAAPEMASPSERIETPTNLKAMTTSVAQSDIQTQGGEDPAALEEALAKKETEINMLRKESEWMKRQLKARDEEVKALKATVKRASAKKAKTKKRAEAQQTR